MQTSVALGPPWSTQVATYDSVFDNNFTSPPVCHTGTNCGQITSSSASSTWSWDSIAQTIHVASHTPYHLSAWVKTDPNTAYGYLGVSGIGSTSLPRNRGWTQITYNFSSAASTSLDIYVGLSQVPGLAQVLLVDDFALTPIMPADELVTDPSFEYDTTNVTPGAWGTLGPAWSAEGGYGGVYMASSTWPAHAGSYVGILQPPSGWHGLYQRIPVSPNTNYTALIWARTSSNIGAGNGYFRIVDQNWSYEMARLSFGYLSGWTLLMLGFNSGPYDYVFVEGGIAAGNSSWLMLDDASVKAGLAFDCSQCAYGCDAANTGCNCPACTQQQRNACAAVGSVCACGECL